MRCRELKLANFCQHKERTISFRSGLSAIVGENGAGKSNILNAMLFALTGDNVNSGTKADNITEGASATADSWVQLTFEHAGQELVVRRNIRPARPVAVLETPEGRIEGDKPVTAAITSLLGVEADVIRDIVIVPQQELLGFLSRTPSERSKQFQKLFGTRKAEELCKLLATTMKAIEIPHFAVSIDSISRLVDEKREALQQWQSAIAEAPADDTIRENLASFRKRQQHAESAKLAEEEQGRVRQEVADLSVAMEKWTAETEAASTAIQSAEALLQELRTRQESETQNLEQAREACVSAERRSRLEEANRDVSTWQKAVQDLTPPLTCEVAEQYTVLVAERDQAAARLSGARRLLSTFSDGVAECPTCGTLSAQLEDRVQEAQSSLPGLEESLQGSERRLQTKQDYLRKEAERSDRLRLAEEQLAAAAAREKSYPAVPEDVPTRQDAENQAAALAAQITATKSEILAAEAALRNMRAAATAQINEYSSKQAALRAGRIREDELRKQLAQFPCLSEEDYRQLAEVVRWWEDVASKKARYQGTIEALQNELRSVEEQLRQAKAAEAAGEAEKAWQGHLEAISAVLHKDAAPRLVAQQWLSQLQHSMNELLQEFSADFTVTADDGLSFIATFAGGRKQPAERLSVGQKVVLALAFRLALNLTIAGSVGALYLDEPTAFLDDRHIAAFEPVLARIREYVSSRGLQVLMVTHEKRLSGLFDEVITL